MSKLAINNDYFVCVVKQSDNILQALYPLNKDLKLDKDTFTYYFYKNELFVSVDKKTKSIVYFDYELRPFITSHILLTSISRNIPPKYIKSYNTNNVETKMIDLLPEPHLKTKEKNLMVKLLRFIDNKNTEDKDMIRNIKRFNDFFEKDYQ